MIKPSSKTKVYKKITCKQTKLYINNTYSYFWYNRQIIIWLLPKADRLVMKSYLVIIRIGPNLGRKS